MARQSKRKDHSKGDEGGKATKLRRISRRTAGAKTVSVTSRDSVEDEKSSVEQTNKKETTVSDVTELTREPGHNLTRVSTSSTVETDSLSPLTSCDELATPLSSPMSSVAEDVDGTEKINTDASLAKDQITSSAGGKVTVQQSSTAQTVGSVTPPELITKETSATLPIQNTAIKKSKDVGAEPITKEASATLPIQNTAIKSKDVGAKLGELNRSPTLGSQVLALNNIVDVGRLEPLQYIRIDGYGNSDGGIQYAALHKCLNEQSYSRVMDYALCAGSHPDLVNLATCDPSLFKWGDGSYATDLEGNIVRFFIVGLTAATTQLFAARNSKAYNNNGRAGLQLLPAVGVGRRAVAAIAAFGEWNSLRTYAKDSALNLSTLSQGKDSNIAIATEGDAVVPIQGQTGPTWRDKVMKAFTNVPLYDGHAQDFNLSNFQSLPRVDHDLPKGSVVCAVFTLRKWGNPATVAFNIMSCIWLAERGAPTDTSAAREELPYLKIRV